MEWVHEQWTGRGSVGLGDGRPDLMLPKLAGAADMDVGPAVESAGSRPSTGVHAHAA